MRRPTRACAREPDEEAPREAGSFLAAALAPPIPEERSDPRRPWPLERFDVAHQEAVELVELFEEEFGRDAKFSFKDHGPVLERILARFDRFTGPCGDRSGYTLSGRRRRGAGWREAEALIRRWGRLSRVGRPDGAPARVQSLAYFLPKLDQLSKRRRREWKFTYGKESQ